jgi:hypothetical protein
MGKIMGRVTTSLLLLLLSAQVVRPQAGSVQLDPTGNVLSPPSTNFPTGSLKVNNVAVVGGTGTGTVLISNSVWVDPAGDNVTCAKGDLTKPCATALQATTKVTAGDVIYMAPRPPLAYYDQGTTPLPIPPGVALIGAGADFTVITTAVPASANRAGVELGDKSALQNLTVINTDPTGAPVGNMSSTPTTFTAANISGCKIVGVAYGIRLSKTGTTGLEVDSSLIQTKGECLYQDTNVNGTTNVKRSDFISDGADVGSGASSRARAIYAGNGLITFQFGSVTAINAVTNNIAAESASAGSVLLRNISINRNTTATNNYDFANAGTFQVDNASRVDGAAPRATNPTTVTYLSRYARKEQNGADFDSAAAVRTNLQLQLQDADLDAIATQGTTSFGRGFLVTLDQSSALDYIGAQSAGAYENSLSFINSFRRVGDTVDLFGDTTSPGASKYYGTDSGGTRGFYTLPTGGPGGSAIQQDITDTAGQVIASGVTVINVAGATPFTVPRTVELPLASTYSPLLPLVILDPKKLISTGSTLSVAKSTLGGGTDTIDGSGSNKVVMGVNEGGGSVQLFTDGVSSWRTISKGGGSRMAGYVDGTNPANGNTVRGDGLRFSSSPMVRSSTTAFTATWTPDFDSNDQENMTLTGNITTINPPVYTTGQDSQNRTLRLTSDSSSHTITGWDPAAYVVIGAGITLPATIGASKTIYINVRRNQPLTRWDVLAVGVQQ